jgi:hypothetical protein
MNLYRIWTLLPTIIFGVGVVAAWAGQGFVAGAFTVLAQGTQSGIERQRFETLRDAATLLKLWKAHTAGVSPAPPLPDVDFSKEMVIAAFAGTRNSGGYALSVSRISVYPDRIEIDLSLTQPGSDCMVTEALTQPFVFAKTGQSGDKPVNFNLAKATDGCGAD